MEALSESDVGIVEREELMVSPSGNGEPTMRVAHFLQPTVTSIEGPVFELPSSCFSSLPHTFEPKNWPLKLAFHGCSSPQDDWKIWVGKMASLHESTWKKAGIYEAILNSTYSIQRNHDLILGLAEKWCPETKSFIFSWGEATITLEDMVISGYSVSGSSVFSQLETDEQKSTAEKLKQTRIELGRTGWNKADYSLWEKTFMDSGSEIEHEAFLAFWLTRFVFPVSSVILRAVFPIAIHLARGTRIALAPAVLAGIYRDLSLLKEKIVALAQLDHFENEQDSSALVITLHSPLQLVQIWAWERFLELRPKPNLIQLGEPRFAQWHKTMLRVENVRTVLDSAEESFDWRPYAKTLKNWSFPEFYAEKEMWVSIDHGGCEELEPLALCLRISELIGCGYVEHYFPHRVAMQFGLDQDLPACVAQVSDYSKSISYANLYVPQRLYEADVTTRYLEWWKESLLHLQAAKEGVLIRKRIFRSSEITRNNRSKRAKRVNHVKDGFSFSSSKMKTKKSVVTSTQEKEDDSDASNSAGLPSKTLPLSLIIKKEINESPFPPGFLPKTNLMDARNSTSKRHSDAGNGLLGDGSVVEREELMVSASGDGEPTMRSAHFLQPTVTSIDGQVFEVPSAYFSSIPPTFQPKNWPLKVNFYGWRLPQKEWRKWVEKMASLHEPTWKKAGIHEAILNSIYEIRKNTDLVLGLAEKWCSETKSFIFSWGEATITLEDLMIHGYSVLGSPVFIASDTEELKKREERLNQARLEFNRISTRRAQHCLWMKKFINSGSDVDHEAFLALGTKIALAPAILATIYRDLSILKEKIAALTKFNKSEVGDSRLAVTIWSPFQLVQIWAWERFIKLRPKPNLIKIGKTRFARWHKMMMIVENVRRVLDSAKENFDWRPYAKSLRNWNLPEFYVEKEMWVLVDSGLSEEFESFAHCLRISELVGLDCVEQYLPHRVAMQFGIDQDLPACVSGAIKTVSTAWSNYIKPIGCANMYVPSRLFEADVTTRYSEWWKQSVSRLRKSLLRPKRTFRVFKITNKTSKRVKGFCITSSKIQPKRLKGTMASNFTKSFNITSKKLDGIKKGDGASSSHPNFALKSSEKLPELSKWSIKDINTSVTLDSPLKQAEKSVEISKEKEKVCDVFASAGLPSDKLPPSQIVQKKLNDSPGPPDFPPKSNLVEAEESTDEDGLTISESFRTSKRHDAVGSGQLGDGESLGNLQSFSSFMADKEVTKFINPLTVLIENVTLNATVETGLETAKEDADATETGSPSRDMESFQGSETDDDQYEAEIQELQIEERVSVLEKIFAELKAKRCAHK
ncbi:hypothetical protein LWI29_013843 [Acer saccharum]|uniref:Aminotransferase-like plant mobile domain-containing protein n=1 Tax=Acer saccharum TaxID=4024 RepID=A0AA39T207_ACESA|nr:hypothetical protein LWI29_013843 [Acer saccharum]